ncbi:XRE family transcriptional regulator [Chryseosolibacter indicus]|uniref:LexA family transcriptional regulator n=1 Tax=Chryseosolibacter indicus TaxID=2782351 RepID=A0ABS5VTE1_9BACT|nr:LexA family transcriptional regulator [Chryseosolibacter indicus]MBT1703246.1 LexA family transcriptional regulator [Chryseosolibacter indicus]
MLISKNLKFLRTQYNLTQKQLAEKLGLKQAAIGAYEEERASPPLSSLLDLTKIFKVNLDLLVNHDLSKVPQKEWKAQQLSRGKEILAITVDKNNKENVELVSQKASAGYLAGFHDTEFIQDLPKISLPVLPKNTTYRAFEIQGDSMLPVQPGAIIFGEYVDDLFSIKSGKLYVLVLKDGIVFKRAFNFLEKENKLLLVSDNRLYAPYFVNAEDVLEVWKAQGFFSNKFPELDANNTSLAEQMALHLFQAQQQAKSKK